MPRKSSPGSLIGIQVKLDTGSDPLEIVAISDLHIGDPNCNMEIVSGIISGVQSRPNRYAVLAGDLLNTAIHGSKSDAYREKLTPHQQLDRACDLLEPVSDKILAAVPGNHEERISRSVGVDMPRLLAQRLGIESRYRPDAAVLFVHLGRDKRHSRPITYSIYINHGHGGGRRTGGKLNSLQDYGLICDADCYIVGHTHLPAAYKSQRYRLSPQTGRGTLVEQLFVNTASALTYGGYGARGGYQPASNAYPVISFSADEKRTAVTI